ncbi:unnamed protein product [Effrenium voratum]|nr:unnamed protein product [Effrenium voratum]
MELPAEFRSHRRMVYDAEATQRSSTRPLSSDAAHRRSTGVGSCLDMSLSDGEAQDQVRTRLRSGRSTGVRGMQQARPETLDENPSGEESADGFPSERRSKRRISPPGASANTTLATGLTNAPAEECMEAACGMTKRGKQSEGSKEYRRGGPGPWDPLPTGASKKDGWGRLSPRQPPPHTPRVPFGTQGNAGQTVKRFYSAPPLPYGSEADVPEPSVPPQSGIPLGLTVPSARDNPFPEVESMSPRREGKAKALSKPRCISAERIGKSLMSSEFVARQRQSSRLRGGASRLCSGGNLAPCLNRPHERISGVKAVGAGQAKADISAPSARLDEAYNKCLQSLHAEIEQLQSRSMRLEREVQKTKNQNGVLKCQPNTTPQAQPGMTPA